MASRRALVCGSRNPGAGTVQAIWLSPIAGQAARTSSHIQAAPFVQNKEDRPRKRVCTMIFLSKRKREKAENGIPFLPQKARIPTLVVRATKVAVGRKVNRVEDIESSWT